MAENLEQQQSETTEQQKPETPVSSVENPEQNMQPDKYVMMAIDPENPKVEVVSGIDEEGKLKTLPPDADDTAFMRVDQHLNPIENFMKNLWTQYNEARKLKFFRVPENQIQEKAELLNEAIKDNSKFQDKSLKEIATSRPYYNENLVNEESGKFIGFEKSTFTPDDWDRLIRGYKTKNFYRYDIKGNGFRAQGMAQVSLKTNTNNTLDYDLHSYNPSPYLGKIFGVKTTEQDQINLYTTGNLGRVVNAKFGVDGEEFPAIISLDRMTNEPTLMRVSSMRIPDEYRGAKISPDKQSTLANGEAVFLENMVKADGTTYSNWVQMNADVKGLAPVPNRQMQKTELGKVLDDPKLFVPLKVGGVALTPLQRAIVATGGTIELHHVKCIDGNFRDYYYKQVPGEGMKTFNMNDPKYLGMRKEVENSLENYKKKIGVRFKNETPQEEHSQKQDNVSPNVASVAEQKNDAKENKQSQSDNTSMSTSDVKKTDTPVSGQKNELKENSRKSQNLNSNKKKDKISPRL